MNYPTKKGRLISPLYLCYGNSFVYAADQRLFDISVAVANELNTFSANLCLQVSERWFLFPPFL